MHDVVIRSNTVCILQTGIQYTSDTLARGKKSVAVNLKRAEGVEVVRRMCCKADVLIEPFRTGKLYVSFWLCQTGNQR